MDSNAATGAKGFLDSINMETVVHCAVIVLLILVVYHVVFHTA